MIVPLHITNKGDCLRTNVCKCTQSHRDVIWRRETFPPPKMGTRGPYSPNEAFLWTFNKTKIAGQPLPNGKVGRVRYNDWYFYLILVHGYIVFTWLRPRLRFLCSIIILCPQNLPSRRRTSTRTTKLILVHRSIRHSCSESTSGG